MRYTYTESIGEIYITHEFEDLTLSEWLVVYKELNPSEGVPVEEGLHTNKCVSFEDLLKLCQTKSPLTYNDLKDGGWFLKDTSLEARDAFNKTCLSTYGDDYHWCGDGFAADLSDGVVYPNRISSHLEEGSTKEIILIDGKFYHKH